MTLRFFAPLHVLFVFRSANSSMHVRNVVVVFDLLARPSLLTPAVHSNSLSLLIHPIHSPNVVSLVFFY